MKMPNSAKIYLFSLCEALAIGLVMTILAHGGSQPLPQQINTASWAVTGGLLCSASLLVALFETDSRDDYSAKTVKESLLLCVVGLATIAVVLALFTAMLFWPWLHALFVMLCWLVGAYLNLLFIATAFYRTWATPRQPIK